jgi:phosphoglycerate dehydrogenase-like enzyme
MKKKLKVAVALTKKCSDFDAFSEVLYSSPKIKKRVNLVFSEDKEHLKKIISDADILVCMKVDREAFLKAKNLKWVHIGLAGVEKSLFPELISSQILLTSSKGIHSITVAELILGMILAFAKGILISFNYQKKKAWGFEQASSNKFDLEGKILGIVGLGNIGLEVAKRGKALGMMVYGKKNKIKKGEKIKYVDKIFPKNRLNQLLKESDFVVLALPYTQDTHHLIGQNELNQMKKTAFLINTARGAIVDEEALIKALEDKKIAGAGLDVFEIKPLPSESKLWDFDNVILTPHIGGAMPDYYRKVAIVFKENLERFLDGKKLKNLVDKKLGY